MNPISGTFRKKPKYAGVKEFKQELLHFLHDKKEINELFMVVDEELKMMAKICQTGGMIVGPLLKEMAKLIHTEYLLRGESDEPIWDVFRQSMRAPTLTGSPMESACAVIERYETEPRGYYAGALALHELDDEGREVFDSCIIIRTVHIDQQGSFEGKVGATLVRDSDPTSEYQETLAKM